MKCPRPQCGNEVARLVQRPSTAQEYPDGLCATCDQIERAHDETTKPLPAVIKENERRMPTATPASAAGPTLCKRGCGKAVHRGSCRKSNAPNGAFSNENLPQSGRKRAAAPDAGRDRILAVRAGWVSEKLECEERIRHLEIKIGVADDILGVVK